MYTLYPHKISFFCCPFLTTVSAGHNWYCTVFFSLPLNLFPLISLHQLFPIGRLLFFCLPLPLHFISFSCFWYWLPLLLMLHLSLCHPTWTCLQAVPQLPISPTPYSLLYLPPNWAHLFPVLFTPHDSCSQCVPPISAQPPSLLPFSHPLLILAMAGHVPKPVAPSISPVPPVPLKHLKLLLCERYSVTPQFVVMTKKVLVEMTIIDLCAWIYSYWGTQPLPS